MIKNSTAKYQQNFLYFGLLLIAILLLRVEFAKAEVRQTDRAKVTHHHAGKGKYEGMLGALTVKSEKHGNIKISIGFSMNERRNPPPINSIIEYKYKGFSSKGRPRYVSFVDVVSLEAVDSNKKTNP